MSMWINLARVTPDVFALIQEDPSQIEAIFFSEETSGPLSEIPSAGLDLQTAQMTLEALAEVAGEEFDEDMAVFEALAAGDELDFDAGMGPAWFTQPEDVAKILTSEILELDDDFKALVQDAHSEGEYLIGVIS